MAIDVAAICNDIECNCATGFTNETFKTYVLQLLCAMASGISEIADPTPMPPVLLTFGTISTAFPGTGQVSVAPDYYRSVTITNSTDQPVLFSVDGSNTYATIPIGETVTIPLVRRDQLFFRSVVAPTSGSVRVTGF